MNNLLKFLIHKKREYLLSCTKSGEPKHLESLSKAQRLKATLNNMHLMEDMEFSEQYGFPIIKAIDASIDVSKLVFVPYSSRKGIAAKDNIAVTFFEDDYKFAYATWNRLSRTTLLLKEYTTLLTPDHSLYVDMPDAYNIFQIYKSRFAGAYWQKCGYNVIATASWGNADSFSYCFEGLPKNTIIAVCGIGINRCKAATKLWEMGIRQLVHRLSPTMILVYGYKKVVPGVTTRMIFIPPYVKSKLNRRWK